MKFIEVDSRAIKLFKEGHEVKFYEMVLYFAVEELFEDIDEIELTDSQFDKLLRGMVSYLADNYDISPWCVADAIVNLVREYGANTVIADCDGTGRLLEKALENI